MSENIGGAQLQLAQLINDRLTVESKPGASGKEYGNDKEVIIGVRPKVGEAKQYKITSQHPAALVVFEKKLKELLESAKNSRPLLDEPAPAAAGDADDMEIPQFGEF